MTKLVKNLIIGGSATTVLAGGGTGIALALSGKKSSNSNNAVVAKVVNNNTQQNQVQHELNVLNHKDKQALNFIKTISGTPDTYTGFHRANIRNEIKKLDNNLLVSQQKAEIDGRTFIATQMQTPMPTTQEYSIVSPELELNRQANMEALVAAGKHELLMKQKADKKAEDKAIAEALQEKVESDRVAALPNGTKDLKEGTKFDFVTSNIEYEIKKQAATDAEYARVAAETEARHANLVEAFNKREADKDLKQLYSKIATENIAQVEQIKRELTDLARQNLREIKKETLDARSLYAATVKVEIDRLNEHNNVTEQQRQALILDKVNEIQNQVNSQISTMFGNHPITLDHNTVITQSGLNSGTQTFRYGTDLISMFGTNGATTLNHILNSLEVDGVKFGLKTFIQDGKLNILAVAIDNAGHELKTSDHAPVKIDFKEPTRTISATSGQDIKYALGVAIKADPNKDLSEIIGDTLQNLATSKQLSLEVPSTLTDNEANQALIHAIQTYAADGKDVSTDLKNRYVYTVLYAVRMLTDKVNRHQITFKNDSERETFNNQILSIQKALTDAGY